MTSAPHRVHVAVGVIINNQREVLLAQRAVHLHQGGLWEFPGGKVEKNETIQEALHRELNEELGIDVKISNPFIKISHDYADKSVLLDVWVVEKFTGVAQGKQNQPLCWVPINDLKNYALPQANREIVSALQIRYKQLSHEIMITGHWDDPDDFVCKLMRALECGVKLVHFRAHSSSFAQYQNITAVASRICKDSDAILVANTSLEWFQQLNVTGLHLTTQRLMHTSRRPVHDSLLFSASCHNLVEMKHAESINVDYIMLGPVQKTTSHPDVEPIGIRRFSEWVSEVSVPVYALGGMTSKNLDVVFSAGGYGIASISGYWPT